MGEVGGSGPLRVAIVGLGPKGLFALERLLDRAARVGLPREIQVDAYEPHAVPGAGPVYEPTQPDFLRMNFEADRIDAWPEGSQAVPEDLQLSFVAWRSRNPDLGDDAYPPRAYVGRYLAECLQAVSREPPPGVSVEIHQSRVTAVRQGESWSVQCGDTSRDYDEVIIATGHASDWTGALRHGWEHAARLVDAVFPVDQKLTTEAVPPGSRVAARGFALTFIDMALALTEGRGGVFESEGDRLRYRPSGAEPAVIFPFSRTGQPMLAKPELAAAKESAEWERAAAEAEASLLRAPPPDPVGSTLVGVVDQLASNPDNPAAGHDAARGAAWRAIYGAVVERFGGHGLSPEEWPAFHALAAEMERLAFGPPPLNVASIAALVDAGIVDTTHARGGLLETADGRTQLSSSVGTAAVDVVVDAVLAPPGIVGVDDPLVAGLVAAGHARVAPGQRGIEVSPDATCVAADGSPARGLAACGRPTEDSVIGNDTLSRTLHPQLDRWADRVIARAIEPASLRRRCRGVTPLTARLEPWQVEICERTELLDSLIAEHGSPVNLIDPSPMGRNAHELKAAARSVGVPLRVFFARKANKAIALVDEAKRLGLGVDVASERELSQVLDRGVDPADVIVTAAVKSEALIELSVRSGATLAIDNFDELDLLLAVAARSGTRAPVALRFAPHLPARTPTRFGLQPEELLAAAGRLVEAGHAVAGLHFHLDGYDAADRVTAIGQAVKLIDRLRERGADPKFVDIGGGIPMSYLDSREEWEAFWANPVTLDGHEIGHVYPYHQQPIRGEWMSGLLSSVAEAISSRGLELRCEPGRSLLDGCGITVARVMFTKRRSDGETLIGLGMNRTQVRSTSDDFLVDPLLVPRAGRSPADATDGFLVGAYCIERELLTWRRLEFPEGAAVGDLVAFPNTAGYLMHILESASHQIPLARNLIVGDGEPRLDAIDQGALAG